MVIGLLGKNIAIEDLPPFSAEAVFLSLTGMVVKSSFITL